MTVPKPTEEHREVGRRAVADLQHRLKWREFDDLPPKPPDPGEPPPPLPDHFPRPDDWIESDPADEGFA